MSEFNFIGERANVTSYMPLRQELHFDPLDPWIGTAEQQMDS